MKRIRIKGLTGEESFLNGREGDLTNPFGCFPVGDVGVYLDNKIDLNMGICNLNHGEYEVVN